MEHKTTHKIYFSNSQKMEDVPDESVNLIITSPIYPMIEMWDKQFSLMNKKIAKAIEEEDGVKAYELMNIELNAVWNECIRVMAPGGIICINIGDATRTIGKRFAVYPNHARIIEHFISSKLDMLPSIIWKKTSNKPNKFMGSGMLPVGAYITMEHEHILIFRKNPRREFKNDKELRRNSAFFWEERNKWFSNVWSDVGGVRQNITSYSRKRSAAYHLNIPFRLINMYSIYGDTILDPFMGLGTTALAAAISGRNSIGYEICPELKPEIDNTLHQCVKLSKEKHLERLKSHHNFIQNRINVKYVLEEYDTPVMTNQETSIKLFIAQKIKKISDTTYSVQGKLGV